MKIEVFYFENCPNHLPTLERIHQVLREEGCDAEVREVLVCRCGDSSQREILRLTYSSC